MANSVFPYLPLDDSITTIRLLNLLPGEASSPLRCTIEHEVLTETVEYVALSYAWKDPYLYPDNSDAHLEHLTVNDNYYLFIGKNIAMFLRQVRQKERASGRMWIDAICIDQENLEERNMHVLKMGDIYRKAEIVTVWLGLEHDESDLAFQLFKDMEALGDRPSQGTLASDIMDEVPSWDDVDKQGLLEHSRHHNADRKWVAATKLFKRAWWSRTWVVQEALLPRTLVFRCGNATLGWQTVWLALENLWLHAQVARIARISFRADAVTVGARKPRSRTQSAGGVQARPDASVDAIEPPKRESGPAPALVPSAAEPVDQAGR